MKHIPLRVVPDLAPCDESAALEGESGVLHILSINCADCGRTTTHRGRCRKCGGRSWLPAGHVDRFALRRLREQQKEALSD